MSDGQKEIKLRKLIEEATGFACDVVLDTIRKAGYVVVPAEPNGEIIAASGPAMKGVDAMLSVARVHGAELIWADANPPMWHAYKAMVACAAQEVYKDHE